MVRNLLVVTPGYPADDIPKVNTSVVHFFTKEWVKMGYNVKVVNTPTNFPIIYYWLFRPFQRRLENITNTPIRMYQVYKREYTIDGVSVLRNPMNKLIPHHRFSRTEINKAIIAIQEFCTSNFKPDIIIGHWANPTLEILLSLKEIYKVPICLVLHSSGEELKLLYKNEAISMIRNIDIMAYRSRAIRCKFETMYGVHHKWFYCYSGIPKEYVSTNADVNVDNINVRKFIFVGALTKYKHPASILQALIKSDICDYTLNIIGAGAEERTIRSILSKQDITPATVNLVGRLSRKEVQEYLQKSDVFIMISAPEAFGLVYLEAMANGCITIGAKNQGIDGIIEDGINGFLCTAGDINELTCIINRINNMTNDERFRIVQNSINTVIKFTDANVAYNYIENIKKLML